MRMWDYLTYAFTGLALHQTASITHKAPSGWGYLAGLAIGVEGTFPVFLAILRKLKVPAEIISICGMAYQLAFLMVGAGVALGWLLDFIFKVDREK